MTTMNDLQPPANEAGWYADPTKVWAWRWFDGKDWTGTVNDGTANHSDLASLVTARDRAMSTNPLPPSPSVPMIAPPAPSRSVAGTLGRIVGWCVAGVVAVFFFFVGIGFLVSLRFEPVAQVEGAEVYGIVPVDGQNHDELWFVVVDAGTTADEIQPLTEQLLELPEAQGRRISFTFYDDDAEVEEFVEFTAAVLDDSEDIARVLEVGVDLDTEVLVENTVAHVSWSPQDDVYLVCGPEDDFCDVDSALATFSG